MQSEEYDKGNRPMQTNQVEKLKGREIKRPDVASLDLFSEDSIFA